MSSHGGAVNRNDEADGGDRFSREGEGGGKPRESTRVVRAVINILSVERKGGGGTGDGGRRAKGEMKRGDCFLFPSLSRSLLPSFSRAGGFPWHSARIKRARSRGCRPTGRPPPSPIGSKLNSLLIARPGTSAIAATATAINRTVTESAGRFAVYANYCVINAAAPPRMLLLTGVTN